MQGKENITVETHHHSRTRTFLMRETIKKKKSDPRFRKRSYMCGDRKQKKKSFRQKREGTTREIRSGVMFS